MTDLTPREIVSELDRFIIGQKEAKRAVAVALRSRWRRRQLSAELRDEVYPKNILMIGPTGVGKTEISRRLAKLARAPFIKVEATKFTEVGYVGRDVEQIIRDLVDAAIQITREAMREAVKAKALASAEERVIEALAGRDAREQTREMFRAKLRSGELDDKVIELEVNDSGGGMPMFEIPGQPGANMGMMNLGDIFGKAFGGRKVRRKMTVADSYEVLLGEEADKLL
ncbi:MAG: AAA family ATPase, partial [Paracoccaceae bacterium]|nr:AAA family ATPase [Paracoccaceae bacterium]